MTQRQNLFWTRAKFYMKACIIGYIFSNCCWNEQWLWSDNEFVAVNRTLAISYNQPVADGDLRNSTDGNRLIAVGRSVVASKAGFRVDRSLGTPIHRQEVGLSGRRPPGEPMASIESSPVIDEGTCERNQVI